MSDRPPRATAVSDGQLPRLAVLYDERSVDVFRFAEAGRDTWRTVWLVDDEFAPPAPMLRLLGRLGTVVDITGLDPRAVARAVGGTVGGLVVLNETRLAAGAELAPALGVDFYTPSTVVNLTDKSAQRAAFRAAGLPTPASVLVPAGSSADDAVRAAAELRMPAVVKLARGRASSTTGEVRDADDITAFLTRCGLPTTADFVIEERIPDGWQSDERPYGDYVSVESFLSAGRFAHYSVTGRAPLASGFRETGAVMPSPLPREQWPEIFAVAETAIRSLGAHLGVFHTEIKLSPVGLRVIEVNGRLGAGSITWLAERVGSRSLLNAVGRVALGLPVDFAGTRFDGVGFFYCAPAPAEARGVRAVSGLDEVRRAPGVEEVTLAKSPGATLDPATEGTLGYVYAVRGHVDDHETLWALLDWVRTTVLVEYET